MIPSYTFNIDSEFVRQIQSPSNSLKRESHSREQFPFFNHLCHTGLSRSREERQPKNSRIIGDRNILSSDTIQTTCLTVLIIFFQNKSKKSCFIFSKDVHFGWVKWPPKLPSALTFGIGEFNSDPSFCKCLFSWTNRKASLNLNIIQCWDYLSRELKTAWLWNFKTQFSRKHVNQRKMGVLEAAGNEVAKKMKQAHRCIQVWNLTAQILAVDWWCQTKIFSHPPPHLIFQTDSIKYSHSFVTYCLII